MTDINLAYDFAQVMDRLFSFDLNEESRDQYVASLLHHVEESDTSEDVLSEGLEAMEATREQLIHVEYIITEFREILLSKGA